MDPRYFCLICRRPTRGAGEECPHCKSRQVARVGATPQRLAIVFCVMLALFVATGYYNRAFNNERQQRAEEHFRLGRTLADYGYFDAAIKHFGDALVYNRGDFDYRMGLTLALYQSGRYQEVEPQLLELRAANATQASVNRMLARLAAQNGRIEEAVQSYRTAIYGRWDQNPEQNRVETRLELVDLLESEGETLQLVGELLSLLREEPANDELLRRAGLLFLDAGAAGEAIRVLSPMAEGAPDDAELHGALGRAYFSTAQYGLSRMELRRALAVRPNPDLSELLVESDAVVSLDPNYRRVERSEPRITQRARYRRSALVLRRTVDYVNSCYGPVGKELVGPAAPRSERAESALAAAAAVLADTRVPADSEEATERNMGLASDLWSLRAEACTNIWDHDDALERVLEATAR
jgi:tetratricopeptide (TPR) repeat protein